MSDSRVGLYTQEGAPLPLEGIEVSGELLGAHAHLRVCQRYRNTEAVAIEAVYVFPLPSDAIVTGFRMRCAARRAEGQVKEREAAFHAYDEALAAGHGAALLDQERPNVFTLQVGSLLPGEETQVEVEFLQRVQADEGAIRWMLPTLVAPRYVPGALQGAPTAHGVAPPTARVPDADRISPPVGGATYRLTLDLRVDVGRPVEVESPSHALALRREGSTLRVGFAGGPVALERDLILLVRGVEATAPLSTLVAHRPAGATATGTFALSVVPDMQELVASPLRQDVVLVLDTSGSMEGASLPQAQAALRLCLRQLREGDRFNIIAFSSTSHPFARESLPFTPTSLEQADRWVASLQADGGTELLEPLTEAVRLVPDGLVVLLTDGQVANEAEVVSAVLAARHNARVCCLGIGTNVSDVLLRDLARHTGGAAEFIHPGERVDEKVLSLFSRALAPRISAVEARFEGLEVAELAPTPLPALVDGEPWVLFGRYRQAGRGYLVLRGAFQGQPFALRVPLTLPDEAQRSAVEKLWAAERIRSWEDALLTVTRRRAETTRARIVQLALAHGLVTRHTSFVAVEERDAERRAPGQPATRVVPVHVPEGWDMFCTREASAPTPLLAGTLHGQQLTPARSMATVAPFPASVACVAFERPNKTGGPPAGSSTRAMRTFPRLEDAEDADAGPWPAAPACLAPDVNVGGYVPDGGRQPPAGSAEVELLARQEASGLWMGEGTEGEAVRHARATARALLMLSQAGITARHALHGRQVKKAVKALLALLPKLTTAPAVAELALGSSWLVTTGPRTRQRIASAIRARHPSLAACIGDEGALRQRMGVLAGG